MSFINSPPSKKKKHDFTVPSYLYNNKNIYRVEHYLGKGGYALCYRVFNEYDNTYYAAKLLSKETVHKSNTSIKFFENEIKIHKTLDHPNIVKFIENFETPDLYIIILELCGESLSRKLHRDGKFKEEDARKYVKDLISGVDYLHQQNIVHRDIKLGNMLLGSKGEIKLCDFGMAGYIGEFSSNICGTPNYISPEVLFKEEITPYTDIWSIGVVLYCMLFGKAPFETHDTKLTYKRIKGCIYYFPTFPVSNEAKSLIRSLLVRTPSDRLILDDILDHNFLNRETIIQKIYNNLPNSVVVDNVTDNVTDDVMIVGYKYKYKYGMFYKLSNGEFGARFNDNDRMITQNDKVLHKKRLLSFDSNYSGDINKKLKLLEYVMSLEMSVLDINNKGQTHIVTWLKTKQAYFFKLSNDILQVHFNDDTWVIIFNKGKSIFYLGNADNKINHIMEVLEELI